MNRSHILSVMFSWALVSLPATGDVINLTDTTVTQGGNVYTEDTHTVGGTVYHAGAVNGAIFRRVEATDDDNSGAGTFRNLYKVSTPTGNVDTESGYNRAGVWDASLLGGSAHLMTVGDLQTDTTGDYFIFTVDANEAKNAAERYVSMDAFRLFVEPQDGNYGTDVAPLPGSGEPGDSGNVGDLGTEIYNMDAGGDSTILMDYSTSNGSGTFDMFVFVPTSTFAGLDPNSYVYLYTEFGGFGTATVDEGTGTGEFGAGAGGEEIAYYGTSGVVPITVTSLVPEPHTSVLAAMGGLVLALRRRRA